MSDIFQKGATSESIYIFVRDPSTMQGLTGLLFSTSGLKAYYTRNGAAAVAITLATQTVTGAFSSGGFVEVSAANAPGLYRLDIPNAALVTGVNGVRVTWTGGGTLDDGIDLALVDYDPTTVDKTGFSLSATGLDPVLDSANLVETGLSWRGFFRLAAATLFGKSTSTGGTTTYRNAVADSKARVTSAAVTGTRSSVTTDQT